MKRTFCVFGVLILVVGGFIVGCGDGEKGPSGPQSGTQRAVIVAQQQPAAENAGVRSLFVDGGLYASPLPYYYTCCYRCGTDSVVVHDAVLVWGQGAGRFVTIGSKVPFMGDSIAICLQTEYGTLKGAMTEVDSVSSVEVAPMTTGLHSPITVKWNANDADFAYIYGYYTWSEIDTIIEVLTIVNVDTVHHTEDTVITWDTLLDWHYETLDTAVQTDSVVYAGERFAHDGTVSIHQVLTLNGTFPKRGAVSNMAGSGNGFMYVEHENGQVFPGATVTVGEGWYREPLVASPGRLSTDALVLRLSRLLGVWNK